MSKQQRRHKIPAQEANSDYNLSEGSKKSNSEFGEANIAASLLYQRFKQIMDLQWSRDRLDRFKRLMLAIIRSGPAALSGQRRLWDGDISRLLGYELNPELSARRLFNGEVEVAVKALEEIRIKVSPFVCKEAFRLHKDAALAEVKAYFLSFDLLNKRSEGKSILMISQPPGKDLAEPLELRLPLTELDNRLILVLKKVYFKRKAESGYSIIRDMRYVAADIIAAVYIKNGDIAQYIPEEQPPTYPAPDEPGVWKDMD